MKELTEYDEEHDILFVRFDNNDYESSIDFGGVVIDFNSKYDVIGAEFFRASEWIDVDKFLQVFKKRKEWRNKE